MTQDISTEVAATLRDYFHAHSRKNKRDLRTLGDRLIDISTTRQEFARIYQEAAYSEDCSLQARAGNYILTTSTTFDELLDSYSIIKHSLNPNDSLQLIFADKILEIADKEQIVTFYHNARHPYNEKVLNKIRNKLIETHSDIGGIILLKVMGKMNSDKVLSEYATPLLYQLKPTETRIFEEVLEKIYQQKQQTNT